MVSGQCPACVADAALIVMGRDASIPGDGKARRHTAGEAAATVLRIDSKRQESRLGDWRLR